MDLHVKLVDDEEVPPGVRLSAAQRLGEWADGRAAPRPWMLEEPIEADFSTETGAITAIREVVKRVYAGKLPPEAAHHMIQLAGALIVAERGVMEERIRAMFAELQQAMDAVNTQNGQIAGPKAAAAPPAGKNGSGNGHG